jgi:glycosyltransferase involved in cell wall biosynthesis
MLPLRENGWDGMKTSLYGPTATPEQMFRGAMVSDVVVFQRPMDRNKLEAAKLLKVKGKKIVFDNDDTYLENSGTPAVMIYKTRRLVRKINRNLKDFIKISDLVTVSTNFLAEEYKEYNKNVEVLLNCIDPDDWGEPKENDTGKVRIGIVGSTLTTGDFEVAKDAILKLIERNDVQLVVMGLNRDIDKNSLSYKIFRKEIEFWDNKNVEWHPPVSHAEYNQYLVDLKLDIMLIPRKDNYFNRAKSNLKFLEASMAGIAVVAQGFSDGQSPYQQNTEDTKYMRIIIDNKKWYDEIDNLIRNEQERKEMVQKAREYVLREYNIKTKGHLWEEVYQKIYAGNN